ncbi:MAG: 3-deoxy-manno-octulosonate cytidylyltransferase [Sporomusaceae bacterium]|nr:3-deoxy-manno-octulosonate cytidylyltransferase [Sporomusaceae bacterium]
MNILCIIPARYASTRLPGKPLAQIAGKPMIQRVYERAASAKLPQEVLVATDHEAVFAAVEAFGGKVIMTSPDHKTGTDRLAEVAAKYPDVDVIVNVQGDEPLIDPQLIDDLAAVFREDPALAMATLKTPLDATEYQVDSVVKVVTDLKGYALYFSRSQIPFHRSDPKATVYKHIGMYAYRRDFLLEYAKLPQTPLEVSESLEQLRALEHGYKIRVLTTDQQLIGVDTPEDLLYVNKLFAGGVFDENN